MLQYPLYIQPDEHEGFREAVLRTYLTMIKMELDRRRMREERKLSEQLGFDLVDIGGEG